MRRGREGAARWRDGQRVRHRQTETDRQTDRQSERVIEKDKGMNRAVERQKHMKIEREGAMKTEKGRGREKELASKQAI